MMGVIVGDVVLSEPFSNFIGCHADNGVLSSIEIRRKLEELDSDRALFEIAAGPVKRVADDVFEELLASVAGPKSSALQQTIEFRPDRPLT